MSQVTFTELSSDMESNRPFRKQKPLSSKKVLQGLIFPLWKNSTPFRKQKPLFGNKNPFQFQDIPYLKLDNFMIIN